MDRVLSRATERYDVTEDMTPTPILISLALLPVLMALSTWRSGETSHLMAFLHVPVLAIEMTTLLFVLRSGFRPLKALGYWPRWALWALAPLVAISVGTVVFVAPDPVAAAVHTSCMALHLLFGMALFDLMVRCGATAKDHRRFWTWVVFSSIGYAIILAFFVASIPDPRQFDWLRLGLGVVNVRQLGFYCIPGACAALGMALTADSRRSYWAAVAAASIMIGVVIWSGARGPLIAIVTVVLTGTALRPSLRSARMLFALLSSGVAGTMLSFVHQVPDPRYGLSRILGTAAATSADDMGSRRVTLWLGTLREISERPLFGYGAGQFRLVVPEAMGFVNSPHNLFLQIGLQWGLVGAACFFALFGLAWFRFMRMVRTGPDAYIPAFLVVNGLLIFSLYDVVAYYAYPMVMIAIGMALVLSTKGVNEGQAR